VDLVEYFFGFSSSKNLNFYSCDYCCELVVTLVVLYNFNKFSYS